MTSSRVWTSEFWNRRVLFLSTYKAAVYHWHRGELGTSYLFDANNEGLQSFRRYLQESPNTPMYILVDVFEEEYKRDSIPHVFGADRNAIIARKQARLFHDTPYRYSEIQGREEEGRRDDRIFFSAITNPDIIQPWVKLLTAAKVPLAGINSLPLFTQSLLKRFTQQSNQTLVVSLQSISGLRQTFFYKNEFRISRLVQLPRYGTTSYAPSIMEEVGKIMRYLNSLRLTTEESALDVYFLLAGELLEELQHEYENVGMIQYHFLDINDLMSMTGLSRRVATPFADQYYINEFLKKPPPNRYAPAHERRYHKLRSVRYAMNTASVLLILCSAVWGGKNLVDALVFKQESRNAENKTRFYSQRYDTARARMPQTPVEPEDLRVAVDIVKVLAEYKSTPINVIRVLSKVLERYPVMKLEHVEWYSSTDPLGPRETGQSRLDDRRRGERDAEPTPEVRYRNYHIAEFTGHLDMFDGDYRQAIASINEFAEILRGQKNVYDISVVSLPIDVSSEVNLQGDSRSTAKQADFSMRLVVGVGNEI